MVPWGPCAVKRTDPWPYPACGTASRCASARRPSSEEYGLGAESTTSWEGRRKASMERFGCALIGTGAWGRLVAAEIAHIAGLTLVGVADQDHARAQAAAQALSADAFATVDDALTDERVQAVAIAVPNDRHAEVAHAALSAGKHVLLEKPMALTVHDAEAVASAAQRRGVVLMLN